VRELENVIERAMILTKGPTLSASDLDFGRRLGGAPARSSSSSPTPVAAIGGDGSGAPSSEPSRSFYKRISEQEKSEIVAAVERAQGNIAHAARSLGINRSTLYYRMRKHNLEHLLPTREDPPAPPTPPPTPTSAS
jgi:DNA-binding NtrC family response regulator